MAKIVIIAPSNADVTDAVKLLKGAGYDVDVEEPTPKSLLHIVLGLFGTNAYGFGAGYAVMPGGRDPLTDEEAIEDVVTADGTTADLDNQGDVDIPSGDDDDFNFEGFTVDGEPIKASLSDLPNSVLMVEKLTLGPRATYTLNESAFSFWPADINAPKQRVDVGASRGHTSLEVTIAQGDTQELKVGKDLQEIFDIKESTESGIWSAHEHQELKDDTWYVEKPNGELHRKGLTKWEAEKMIEQNNHELGMIRDRKEKRKAKLTRK